LDLLKIWSQLAASTKKKYQSKGISAQRYNAWVKTGKRSKERLEKQGVSRDEFLKGQSTKDVKRNAAERIAYDRLMKVYPRARAKTVSQGVKAMTGGELHMAKIMSPDKLRRLASRRPDRTVNGKDINPFWYN
jgi:hypothetical protein